MRPRKLTDIERREHKKKSMRIYNQNTDFLEQTGITKDKRCLSTKFHKVPSGTDCTVAKRDASLDITQSGERNYIERESLVMDMVRCGTDRVNIDELLPF